MINRDFKIQQERERHPAMRWGLFALTSAVIGVVVASTSGFDQDNYDQEPIASHAEIREVVLTQTLDEQTTIPLDIPSASRPDSQQERISRQSFKLSLPELQAQQEILDELNHAGEHKWREFKVKSGDSLGKLFKRADIGAAQVAAIMDSGEDAKQLRKIFPGDVIRVLTDDEGKLVALKYEIDHANYLMVERKDDDVLHAAIYDYEIERRPTFASGVIDSSLFLAAQKAGISENVIMELAGIFGWDIDFVLDIRKGDRFTLMYEELYRDGEKIADGEIITAEFVNDDRNYRAIRYTNPETGREEYFTEDGKSMRKAFLRSPVSFSRISSKFSINRYHPILHKFRSHKGVDYAAKRGTPVLASGDGKVIHKGNKGGYGRVVIIQHGSNYSTLYAHLNSYNKHIRIGKRVKQGQTIGYVGSSGLATGPHLHYEFRKNGVHRNPLTVKFPSTEPIPSEHLAQFKADTAPLFAKLDLLTRTQLALNE